MANVIIPSKNNNVPILFKAVLKLEVDILTMLIGAEREIYTGEDRA